MASYPYFDHHSNGLRYADMMATLGERGRGDAVLFHACCHNPCGVSPTAQQWEAITDLAAERGFCVCNAGSDHSRWAPGMDWYRFDAEY